MTGFESRLMVLGSPGARVLAPVAGFGSGFREADLEREVVAHPELLGEDLLVLGSQLAQFTDDTDRLDVLGVDGDGELVLVELKASDSFRVTDLQALAYAGAYATASPDHLARTLRETMSRLQGREVSQHEAQDAIVGFVEDLDSFAEWAPTKRVRIKLVAPRFPRRVLATVKWLGDEYGMPIEAIEAHLYETDQGQTRLIAFNRLLPVRGDEEFGMTARADRRPSGATASRRPSVLRTLYDAGELTHGTDLWFLTRSSEVPQALRAVIPDDDPRLRVQLTAAGGKLLFCWVTPDGQEHLLGPSGAWREIVSTLNPGGPLPAGQHRSVHHRYSLTPGGQTLGQLAEHLDLWAPNDQPTDQ